MENIKIFRSYSISDADDAETFSGPLSKFQLLCHHLPAVKVPESVGVVTSDHATKMAVKPFDPPLPKTPCYIRKLYGSIFSEPELLPIEFFAMNHRPFATSAECRCSGHTWSVTA